MVAARTKERCCSRDAVGLEDTGDEFAAFVSSLESVVLGSHRGSRLKFERELGRQGAIELVGERRLSDGVLARDHSVEVEFSDRVVECRHAD